MMMKAKKENEISGHFRLNFEKKSKLTQEKVEKEVKVKEGKQERKRQTLLK